MHRFVHLLSLASCAMMSIAQTAPGFPIQIDNPLGLEYAALDRFVEPGDMFPEAALTTAGAPDLYLLSHSTENQLYTVIMIDQDVPYNGTINTLLHWLEPNLFRYRGLLLPLPSSVPVSTGTGATYIPPDPPAGSGAHRYSFVLFAQPTNFTILDSYNFEDVRSRFQFDIVDFVDESGLGQVVAGSYLRVENTTTVN